MTETDRLGRVGYVLRKFPVLSETFVLNEILALERMGVTVHVFPLQPSRDPRYHEGLARLKATIHHVPGLADWSTLLRHHRRLARRDGRRYRRELSRVLRSARPSLLWRFLQAGFVADRARRLKLDHLHAHFANRSATVAQLASRLLGTPFSFTAHAFDIYQGTDRRALAGKMRSALFTATVSEYNRRHLASLLEGGEAARVVLVRNGIDLDRFAPPARPPGGRFTIVAIARLVEKKGLPFLIDACRILRDRGRDFRCRIVGKGAQRGHLERLVREWGLEDRIELLPPHTQDEIVARYHEAHLFALPCIVGEDGDRDGLPVSIVEALACGVPVVSTPVNGIPEVVEDGVNGRLVPARNAVALADAIDGFLLGPERLRRMRVAARPSVASEFDQERTARRLRDLLLGSPRPRGGGRALRILYLCADRGIAPEKWNGAAAHFRSLVRAFRALGHELLVLTPSAADTATLGAPVARIPTPAMLAGLLADVERDAPRSQRPAQLARRRVVHALAHIWNNVPVEQALHEHVPRFRPDLVFELYSPFGVAGAMTCRRLGVRHLLNVHAPLAWEGAAFRSQALQEAAETLEEIALAAAARIVANSEEMRQLLLQAGVDGGRVSVVMNGVDLDLFTPEGAALRPADGSAVVVGFSGSLKVWHGVEVLLEAFRILAHDPRMHLLVVGDGPLRHRVRELEKELPGRVTFTGAVPLEEVPARVRGMDVAVAPYPPLERFYFSPLKILDAMACGRASVASSIGQVRTLLRDGETGILVPPGDSRALAAALRRLADDPALRKRMGEAAAREARERHGWGARAAEILEAGLRE